MQIWSRRVGKSLKNIELVARFFLDGGGLYTITMVKVLCFETTFAIAVSKEDVINFWMIVTSNDDLKIISRPPPVLDSLGE